MIPPITRARGNQVCHDARTRLTFEEYSSDWLARKTLDERTLDCYQRTLRLQLEPLKRRRLSSIDVGSQATVRRVAEPAENAVDVLTFVEARGLVPGALIRLSGREPNEGALTVRIHDGDVAVSTYIASNIYVEETF